jgi:HSP20 family molecular chaperone IbpA
VERSAPGQGTRNGGFSFKDQVAGEGEVSSATPFTPAGFAVAANCATGLAGALSSAPVEETKIICGVQRICGWHQGETRGDRRVHRDHNFEPSLREQVTAKFDIPGIAKEDMNVTYHPSPTRLEVSWRTVKITEREIEDGMFVRDVEERTVCRTIPLPDGTRFDEIEAKLQRRLELTYPKMRAARAKPRTPTPQRRGAPRHGASESRTLDAW